MVFVKGRHIHICTYLKKLQKYSKLYLFLKKGAVLGDGYCDPLHVSKYGSMKYLQKPTTMI